MGAGADLIIRIATKGATLAKSQLNALGKEGSALGGKMATLARAGIGALAVGMVALSRGVVESIQAYAKFEDKLTQSLAIMTTTTHQQEEMARVAREVATQTVISATESAEAYFFLASAGLNAEQSMKALPQVAKFAQAGMFDMSLATDLATDAQSALGLTVKDASQNLQNLTRVTDVLVKANTLANATVQQFSEALTNKAGSALKVTNKSIEEGVAVLAAFADRGVKGAEAGEKLNQILRDVSRAVKKNEDAWKASGIVVTDSTGNLLHLGDVIKNLSAGMDGLSDVQKAGLLDQLGLNRGVADAVKILAGAEEQIKAYDESLNNAGGTTEKVAEKQLESFNSQLKILQNQINNLAIDVGQDMTPALTGLVKEAQIVVERLQKFKDKAGETSDAVKILALSIATGLTIATGGVGVAIAGVVTGLIGLGKWIKKSNDEYVESEKINERIINYYERLNNQYSETAEEIETVVEETINLEDILGDTNYTVEQLTNLLDENGVALDDNAKEALKLAEAYEDSLLGGIQEVVDALEALEDRQERIHKAETARNKALEKQTEATNEVAKAQENLNKVQEAEKAFIARRDFALKALQKAKEESKKVTAEEELAILNQQRAVDELMDSQDGSRQKELELQIATAKLTELKKESVSATSDEIQAQNEFQRTLDELEKHYEDIERAQEEVTRAKEREKEAIARVREEQEKLNKITEASLKNTLEYAQLQDDLNKALEGFGKGTKGYNDALEKMAQLTGVKVTDMMKMYDALFAKASQVGLDFDTSGSGTTGGTSGGGGGGGVKYPTNGVSTNGIPPSQNQALLNRIGETTIIVNNNASTIIGSDEEFVEQTAKAFEKAKLRGVVIS